MEAIDERLAARTSGMQASDIREILKVTQNPEILSLAGGLPAPEAFPVDIVKDLCNKVLEDDPVAALQYGPSEGHSGLREALLEYANGTGIRASLENVLVFTGSQQVLDLLGKVLVDPGDNVVVENPTYLGALQSLNSYQPRYIPWSTDEEGVIPEALEEILRSNRVKLIYLVSNFHNPTGRTLSLERRLSIARVLKRYEALLVEDDPYGRLRYEGSEIPTIKSLALDNVIYVSTFSKVLSPGFRLGWVALHGNFDSEAIYWKAIERKVAFVPGKFFHTDGSGMNTMRLNFSNTPENGLRVAIERLATAVQSVAVTNRRCERPGIVLAREDD